MLLQTTTSILSYLPLITIMFACFYRSLPLICLTKHNIHLRPSLKLVLQSPISTWIDRPNIWFYRPHLFLQTRIPTWFYRPPSPPVFKDHRCIDHNPQFFTNQNYHLVLQTTIPTWFYRRQSPPGFSDVNPHLVVQTTIPIWFYRR